MKEISGKQNHINISFLGQAHDLVEALPAVISTNGIPLIVPDVVVGRDEDANSFRCGRRVRPLFMIIWGTDDLGITHHWST
jgi:hypothetical protein